MSSDEENAMPTFCAGCFCAVLIIAGIGGVVAFVFSNNQGTI